MRPKAIVLGLAVFLLGGCCFLDPLPASRYQSRYDIVFHGQLVTKERAEQMDKTLSMLPSAVIRSVKSITLRNCGDSHLGECIDGHCHYFSGDICATFEYTCFEHVLLHEATHAYTFSHVSSRSDFSREWIKTAGDVYSSKNKNEPFCCRFPKDGALTGYGATYWAEDVAETNSYIHLVANGWKVTFFNYDNQPRFIADRRFRKKLDLLLKYGFMSEETYKKFLALKYY